MQASFRLACQNWGFHWLAGRSSFARDIACKPLPYVFAPLGLLPPVGGIEDRDGAAFVAVAAGIVAVGTCERGCGGGDFLDLSVQGRLVVLDLDDQGDAGVRRDLEMFF